MGRRHCARDMSAVRMIKGDWLRPSTSPNLASEHPVVVLIATQYSVSRGPAAPCQPRHIVIYRTCGKFFSPPPILCGSGHPLDMILTAPKVFYTGSGPRTAHCVPSVSGHMALRGIDLSALYYRCAGPPAMPSPSPPADSC